MGLGNDDAELIASYKDPTISVIWKEKDPELRVLIALYSILERAELPGQAVIRLGEYLVSLGNNKSFAHKGDKN